MMLPWKGLSLRLRLTGWYALTLAVVLSIVAVGARLVMQKSVYETLDENLTIRAASVRQFMEANSALAPEPFAEELQTEGGHGLGGGMLRICGEQGETVYQSADLNQLALEKCPVSSSPAQTLETVPTRRRPIRVASLTVHAQGKLFLIQLYGSLHEIHESFERFDAMMWIGVPVLLGLASFGGFWMSRKALDPVDRITQEARSIGIANLSARLKVPSSRDELRRLTETLNDMLGRLDGSVRQMGQFTADASHELRTPLTLIRTAAEFSLRRERTKEELTDAMRKVLRESERMSALVDSLLLLARADSATDQVQFAPLDLCELARDACEQARTLARLKDIGFQAEIPEAPIELAGDESALRRVLLILLDNAVKYSSPGGLVRLETYLRDGEAVTAVTDTGMGIAAEDLPHIFDRFWRADKVRSREVGGAGLGLSIARWIAERHGGSISVQSTPGVGSTFELRIPCGAVRAGSLETAVTVPLQRS